MHYRNDYGHPRGVDGKGSDIKWCSKWRTGKKCLFCRRHAKFAEWSQEWKYYYLIEWRVRDWVFWPEHRKYYCSYKNELVRPRRYANRGLSDQELKKLLKKGCHKNKKCICVKLAQGGAWYCPKCFGILETMAKIKQRHIHDITVMSRNELKGEYLMMYLSGALHTYQE